MQDFRNLKVWQRSHELALAIYEATKLFPSSELYGLTSQLRRASTSIPANIAEGCGRSGSSELARFANVAMGSASELEYHLLLAHDLGLLEDSAFQQLTSRTVELKRMLSSLIVRIRSDAQARAARPRDPV